MRKKEVAVLVAMMSAMSGAETAITYLAVSQQWPWSNQINVDYHLVVDQGASVDVSMAVSNGTSSVAVPFNAVTGSRIALAESGDYRLVIDPSKIDGGDSTFMNDFKVTLSVSPSRADADFPLYRVYNLKTGVKTDVTVKALLNGEWGSVETDYSFAGGTYSPEDATIWTGVTNNPAYKTNCLVMRYVPAGSFTMLAQRSSPGTMVTLTEPFYVGVFEMTQGQCAILNPTRASAYYTNSAYSAARPMGNVSLVNVRGDNSKNFPEAYDPGAAGYIGRLRSYLGDSTFDLPTEARWEYAARAGCSARWPNGSDSTEDVAQFARYSANGGLCGEEFPSWDASPEYGTATVGSYLPNAWGLYDCAGNVAEWCLDRFIEASTLVEGGPYTNLTGSATADETFHIVRGGDYASSADTINAVDCREKINYKNNYRSGCSVQYGKDVVGFRVICAAESSRPSVATQAEVSSATATAQVSLAPDASPFWRTVEGATASISVDWPDASQSATLDISTLGSIVSSLTLVRLEDSAGTNVTFSAPQPTEPFEERVYSATLTFKDSSDAVVSARSAQFAYVLGQGDGASVCVHDPASSRWNSYAGRCVVIPVDAGVESITVDGVQVSTGLDGAVGWYGTVLSLGRHTVSLDDGEEVAFLCKNLGLQVIIR